MRSLRILYPKGFPVKATIILIAFIWFNSSVLFANQITQEDIQNLRMELYNNYKDVEYFSISEREKLERKIDIIDVKLIENQKWQNAMQFWFALATTFVFILIGLSLYGSNRHARRKVDVFIEEYKSSFHNEIKTVQTELLQEFSEKLELIKNEFQDGLRNQSERSVLDDEVIMEALRTFFDEFRSNRDA